MGTYESSPVDFYAANIASIGAGATYSTPSLIRDCLDGDYALIRLRATGAASSTGTVVADFKATCGKGAAMGQTVTFQVTLTLVAAGGAQDKDYLFDCRGYTRVQLVSIKNNDVAAVTAVNASIAQKFGG